MDVINTKGVEVFLQLGSATGTNLTPTAISKANPAVVTVSSVAGLATGDTVSFSGTGFSELDGKTFAIGEVDGTAKTFEVLGSDTTNSTGTLGASPSAVAFDASDMVKLCLSSMEIGADSVNQIDVGTFCDPSAQIPGKATPGTITLAGYANKDDTGLAELIVASDDQQTRVFKIVLPGADNGYLVGKISLAGLSYGVPLEGAVTWTVSGTQASKIKWVH